MRDKDCIGIARILFIVNVAALFAGCSGVGAQPSSDRTEGYVTVADSVRLYYVEAGNGPQVLVAPAALYLEPFLLDELAVGRRVVFYDSRNRGRSDAADLSSISLDRQIEDLEALRMVLGLEQMALLGWSGYGLEMAVYAMRYPERVSRLIQVSPIAPAASIMEQFADTRGHHADRAAVLELDRRAEAGEFDNMPQRYCRLRSEYANPSSFVVVSLADQVPDDCIYPNEWPKNRAKFFRAYYATYGDFDWRQELEDLTVPRLIIHGREDRIPLEGAEAWAKGFHDARLMVLSPSGHFPFIEQKDAVLTAIEIFLGGEWPKNAIEILSDSDRP